MRNMWMMLEIGVLTVGCGDMHMEWKKVQKNPVLLNLTQRCKFECILLKKPSSVHQKSLEDDIPVKISIFWFLNNFTHWGGKAERISCV